MKDAIDACQSFQYVKYAQEMTGAKIVYLPDVGGGNFWHLGAMAGMDYADIKQQALAEAGLDTDLTFEIKPLPLVPQVALLIH